MEITREELECFYRFIDNLESNLEPTYACVLLKVIYYLIKNVSTTITLQLQPGVLERLEQQNYTEYDPLIYEDLKKALRIMANIANGKELFSHEFDDTFSLFHKESRRR